MYYNKRFFLINLNNQHVINSNMCLNKSFNLNFREYETEFFKYLKKINGSKEPILMTKRVISRHVINQQVAAGSASRSSQRRFVYFLYVHI